VYIEKGEILTIEREGIAACAVRPSIDEYKHGD
jgi:hypothetical protein